MAFMDNYEGNKERTDRWIATYPQGRLETLIVEFNAEKGYVLVQAKAFRGKPHNDDCGICHDIIDQPAAIDYAYGYLAAYPDKMKRWMIEDTCTSALMRVMALVMGGAEKATQEVMAQVKTQAPAVEYDYWATKFGDVPSYQTRDEAEQVQEPEAVPMCAHGSMRWNQSKPDAPKPWAGYFCSEQIKQKQCKPTWYVLTSDGTFKPQV
jgi:hypothetical protein